MDTDAIRSRIKGIGWQVKELPVRRKNAKTQETYIAEWKLIAHNGMQSIQATGPNIDDAMKNIGKLLGVIPKNM